MYQVVWYIGILGNVVDFSLLLRNSIFLKKHELQLSINFFFLLSLLLLIYF